ncbi:MAG: hypothetical protein KGI08_09475 [Thaumarchaeota archaeon]|nr:hypothetical protein [Nitrososphaerota archaeon]
MKGDVSSAHSGGRKKSYVCNIIVIKLITRRKQNSELLKNIDILEARY